MTRAADHVHAIGRNDEWETPDDVYESACKWAGFRPELDVAAASGTTKCHDFMTSEIDALRQNWLSDWWCNPPYTKVADFVAYGLQQSRLHGVRGIMLTYAKTDTKWWHLWVEDNGAVRRKFVKGRIRFLLDGVQQGPAPYPSVLLRVGR